jgi:hypothetical protein
MVMMNISNKKLDDIGRATLGSELIEPIYNTEQLLELMKISRKTLQGWRDKGLIKFSAIRGKFYYQHSDVVDMLNTFKIKN